MAAARRISASSTAIRRLRTRRRASTSWAPTGASPSASCRTMPFVLTDEQHRGLQHGLAALQQNLGAAQQNAGALSALLAGLPPAELAAPPAAPQAPAG